MCKCASPQMRTFTHPLLTAKWLVFICLSDVWGQIDTLYESFSVPSALRLSVMGRLRKQQVRRNAGSRCAEEGLPTSNCQLAMRPRVPMPTRREPENAGDEGCHVLHSYHTAIVI